MQWRRTQSSAFWLDIGKLIRAVDGSEADHFDKTLSSAACGEVDYALADERVTGTDRHRRKWRRDGAPEPIEDFREGIPKRSDREQCGELMLQHMCPTGLKFGTVRLKISQTWIADPLEFTLGAQDFHEVLRFRTCFDIPIEVYDVIEVSWACPFHECPEFFRERLGVIVGQNFDAFFWSIAVWMENPRVNRRKNDPLVGGQVKFDAREGVGR